MAVLSGNTAVQGTLTANTVDTVILTAPCTSINVVNTTGSAAIYFTADLVGGANAQPTVNGVDCRVLPADVSAVEVKLIGGNGVVVNLISSGTPSYSVEIL